MKKIDITDLEIIIGLYLQITNAITTNDFNNTIFSIPVVEKDKYIEYRKIYEDFIENSDIEDYENMNKVKLLQHLKKLCIEFINIYGYTIDSLMFIRYRINESALSNNKLYKMITFGNKLIQFRLFGFPILGNDIIEYMIHGIVKDFQSDCNFIYLTDPEMKKVYYDAEQITSDKEAKENLLNFINTKLNRKLKIRKINKKANI